MDLVCVKMLFARVERSAKYTFETALGQFQWAPKHTDVCFHMLLLMFPPIREILIRVPIFADCTPIEVGGLCCFVGSVDLVKRLLRTNARSILYTLLGTFGPEDVRGCADRCPTARRMQSPSWLPWWRRVCKARLLKGIALRVFGLSRVAC